MKSQKTYRLKLNEPSFRIVDGPMSGRSYQIGTVYTEIPEGFEERFYEIPTRVKQFEKTVPPAPKTEVKPDAKPEPVKDNADEIRKK